MKMYKNLLNKAEDFIEENLDKRVSLEEISWHVHLSKFHFHRIFKSATQETLSQFVTRVKMERSAIFLAVNTHFSITDIAYRYGYCDTSSYCRAFKKHFHCTPSEYRKKKIARKYNHANTPLG